MSHDDITPEQVERAVRAVWSMRIRGQMSLDACETLCRIVDPPPRPVEWAWYRWPNWRFR